MSLDALALKNLYLWCQFQSCLVFIISLLFKNFLAALSPDIPSLFTFFMGYKCNKLYEITPKERFLWEPKKTNFKSF